MTIESRSSRSSGADTRPQRFTDQAADTELANTDRNVRTRAAFATVVHTLVYDRAGRLLLLRRANTGFMDGHYTFPGGHRQARETVADAAVRECREEVRIDVQAIRPIVVMPYADGVNFVFEAVAWSGTPAIGEPDKCDALDFALPQRLPKPTAPFVETALKCLYDGKWYSEKKGKTRVVEGSPSHRIE